MDRAEPVEGVEVGEIIGGYRLERLLGAGSVSRVFLGTHVRLGRRAAIKVLLTPMADDVRVTQRFLNEARVVNDIRHPNIVDVSDFIESESPKRLALVMEYIEGPSLKSLARAGFRLSFPQAIGVALQLCAAVEAAHGAGVIHRDLKPDNLLLTSDPNDDPLAIPGLKVVDFGIAKIAGPGEKTATGMMIGTPAYMAPEQIAGKPPPSPATDVFAIGEVIYELLTGKRAYPAGQIGAMIQTKLKGDLPKLDVPDVPGGIALKAMVESCLATRPQDRPRLEEIKTLLLEVCPDAEPAISIDRPLLPPKNSELAELDTVEPADASITKPVELLHSIPIVSTSPTLMSPPTPFDDSTTVVKGKQQPSLPPPPQPKRSLLPPMAAAVAVLVGLAIWTAWPKDQKPTVEEKKEELPIVAVPRESVVPRTGGGFQLITQPEGARVEDAKTGSYLGDTPAGLEHKTLVRVSKDGYQTEEVEIPAVGKSMIVELIKKETAPPPPPPRPATKATKKKDPWDW